MTDPTKEFSSFSMERKECEKCGAVWLNGQHMWTGTGQTGKEDPDYSKCINPMRGQIGGDTWEYRRGYVDGQLDALTKKSGISDT